MHGDRKYVAVDPTYSGSGLGKTEGEELSKVGIKIFPGKIDEFIDSMKQKNEKTRHINIDLPFHSGNPPDRYDFYDVNNFFKKLHTVLLPNGKVFITSEDIHTLDYFKNSAKKHGYSVRIFKKPVTCVQDDKPTRTKELRVLSPKFSRTEYMRYEIGHGRQLYSLEITHGLKKAFPMKEKRRKWTL